jgi:hypothetical protein
MPKKRKKYKYLTKAEEKLAKYKRGLTTSTLAAESAPVISDLLTGLFNDGGQAKPITELYKPRQIEKSTLKDLLKPRKIEKSTPKDLFKPRKRINLNKGGSVTVPTKLGRTKKTKIY